MAAVAGGLEFGSAPRQGWKRRAGDYRRGDRDRDGVQPQAPSLRPGLARGTRDSDSSWSAIVVAVLWPT